MNQILQLPNVEIASASFYFNEGTPEKVLSLQTNLVKCGCDPTVLVYQQPQPHNQTVYYTPKNAKMGQRVNDWIPNVDAS